MNQPPKLKYPIAVGEMLHSTARGEVVQHVWYNDGSFEKKIVPKLPIKIPHLTIMETTINHPPKLNLPGIAAIIAWLALMFIFMLIVAACKQEAITNGQATNESAPLTLKPTQQVQKAQILSFMDLGSKEDANPDVFPDDTTAIMFTVQMMFIRQLCASNEGEGKPAINYRCFDAALVCQKDHSIRERKFVGNMMRCVKEDLQKEVKP